MDEAKDQILDFKALDVEACRICLATDVKLYTVLQGTHLGICMESIGGFTKSYEGLPNYVCFECAPILIKCSKLIEKCKTAEATLLDIFKENGQINKNLIQEQKKTKLDLRSSLDSYLLLNYFHIKYDDDSNTSDFIKIESDPNETININLKNEIKEEFSDEVSDAAILNLLKEMSKGEELNKDVDGEPGKDSDVETDKDSDIEADKDSDVEAIEVDVPVVEIVSDDEKMGGDDFISLKSYKVKIDNCAGLAHHDDIPRYHKTKKARAIGLAKTGIKKKKKKKTVPEGPSPFACNVNHIRRYFNLHPTPLRSTPMEYSCKHCPDTFKYVDDAKDHTFIGCQKPQRSVGDTSTAPNPGPDSNSAPLNQPHIWKEWPGGSK